MKSIALYKYSAWTTMIDENKLGQFEQKILRRICRKKNGDGVYEIVNKPRNRRTEKPEANIVNSES